MVDRRRLRSKRRRRLWPEKLEARYLLTTPTTVSISPSDPSIDIGTPIALTGRFADADGWTDLRLAEFRVADSFFSTPRCLLRYDQNLDLLKLYDEGPWLVAGSPGSGSTVSSGSCSLNATASSTTVVNSTTLDVTVELTFASAMQGDTNLWLRAFDDNSTWGTQDDRGDISIGGDTTAPAAPTGLAANQGDSRVTLDWGDNSEGDLAGYNIYQATSPGGPYTKVNTSTVTTSNYLDAGLSNGTTYYYVVTAVDNASNESTNSAEVFATPVSDTTAPAAPTGLVAAPGIAQVTLDWGDNSEADLDGYHVYQATSTGGPYNQVNTSLLSSSDYVDTGLISGTTYYYVVTAVDASNNESANSIEANATPTSGPLTPTTVSITPDNGSVDVGVPILLTGRFADGNGWTNLRLAEFRVADTFTSTPRCIVRYDQNLDQLKLSDEGPWLVAGSPGSGSTVSSGNCSLNASASSTTIVNGTTLDVTVELTFASAMQGDTNLWLRAFDDNSTWGTQDDRGDISIVTAIVLPAIVIDGYTDAQAYDPNTVQKVYINAQPYNSARLELFDVLGNVIDSVTFVAQPQVPQTQPWFNGFGYTESFTYNIGNLPSGVYFWNYYGPETSQGVIPFVVRDSLKTSPIRVVVPTNTIAAYNCMGGQSMYNCGGFPEAADIVSFELPIQMTNVVTSANVKIPQDSAGQSFSYFWWLQQQVGNLGTSYGVLIDSDLDDPTALDGAEVLVLPGHSEYWTRSARENLDTFIAAGGDVAAMSGNSIWWQSRYENDKLVVYKSAVDDPHPDPLLKTITWDTPSLEYPIFDSIGADFRHGGYIDLNPPSGITPSMIGYKIMEQDSPLLEGTGLQDGDLIPWDRDYTEYDGPPVTGEDANGYPIVDNAVLGFHQVEIVGFDYAYYESGQGYGVLMAMQRTPSSGIVINAGTLRWAYETVMSPEADKLQTINYNILAKLLNDDPIFSPPANPPITLEQQVEASSDDAEERSSGRVTLTSSDLEMTQESSVQQVGMRFNDINVPRGATIVAAYLQFQVDETTSVATSLNIQGHDVDNAPTFTTAERNISSRTKTSASIAWNPVAWTVVGEAGPDQRTSDISDVIQEIVDRPLWSGGNSLAIIITGSGKRVAESFNGDSSGAPLLHIKYEV